MTAMTQRRAAVRYLNEIVRDIRELRNIWFSPEAKRRLFPLENEVEQIARDCELDLLDLTPEHYAAAVASSSRVVVFVKSGAPPVFDPALLTPYVETIYSRELATLHAASDRRGQLSRSAYTLGRIIAAGALPEAHVRESLLTASPDLPTDEAAAIIDRAFAAGFVNPRALPDPKAKP